MFVKHHQLQFSPIIVKHEICGFCGACVAVCRPNALFLFNSILLVNEFCNSCRSCVAVCPLNAIVFSEKGSGDEHTAK